MNCPYKLCEGGVFCITQIKRNDGYIALRRIAEDIYKEVLFISSHIIKTNYDSLFYIHYL